MATYLLVDTANCFFRSRHVVRGDLDTKLGMSLHITLNTIAKAWRDFNADHVVICLEGRSWRKDFSEAYKRNRQEGRDALTTEQLEEDQLFWQTYDEMTSFLRDSTNCTVIREATLEADDLIAGWIQNHPNDEHIILSTDSDYVQLIAPNVKQYNGVQNHVITHTGYFTDKGKPVIDKKTGEAKPAPDPQWLLFEKCMRGDPTDNVFSAYPGVRKKGTKNKVGLLEAFEDKNAKGFNWNNLMLQRWTDHNGVEHRVIDRYNENVTLIDLSAQPADVRKTLDDTINTVESKNVQQVGVRLMKFFAKHDLENLSNRIDSVSQPFNARYMK